METANQIISLFEEASNFEIASHSQRFFKTGPGQYGEGDIFRGIRVPNIRAIAAKGKNLPVSEVINVLHSPYHEDRLGALFMLVARYKKASVLEKEAIFELYLQNTAYINNWDLVDSSCHHIVGRHLWERDRSLLMKLATSDSLWERRIAMVTTYHFIKKDDFSDTLLIAETLLNDPEDLIHKAVGWMLREMGKRNRDLEIGFLDQHYSSMPRTMLRYAIEHFPEPLRQSYLKGTR